MLHKVDTSKTRNPRAGTDSDRKANIALTVNEMKGAGSTCRPLPTR